MERNKKAIAAGLLIMSMTTSCNSSLSPLLAEIGKSFPDAGDAAIQTVLTLINLVTFPMILLEPFLRENLQKEILRWPELRCCSSGDSCPRSCTQISGCCMRQAL